MFRLLLPALVLTLTGCSTNYGVTLGQPYSTRPPEGTTPNKARLVIYKKGYGMVSSSAEGIQASVILDQRERGHIFEGGYLVKYIDPGIHLLDAEVSQEAGDIFAPDLSVPEIRLDAKAGETYYFRHIIHSKPVHNTVTMIPMGTTMMFREGESQRARRAEFLPIAPDVAEREVAPLLEIRTVYRLNGIHYRPWQPLNGELVPLTAPN